MAGGSAVFLFDAVAVTLWLNKRQPVLSAACSLRQEQMCPPWHMPAGLSHERGDPPGIPQIESFPLCTFSLGGYMLFYGQPMLFELAGAHISGKSSFFHDYNSVFFRECMLYCCHGAQEIQKTREIRKQHAQKREAAIVFPGIAASRPINPRTGLGRRCCGLACGRLCSPIAGITPLIGMTPAATRF